MSIVIEPTRDDFEQIVSQHYEPLYRFALSLAHAESEACDLTQQTFYIWATKGHQVRERSKIKSWLFTTLHREFLRIRKRATRFPHHELTEAIDDLPTVSPEMVDSIDGQRMLELLAKIAEPYRAALNLFYMEEYSYKAIAEILEVPIGTVRSRISRGIAQLQETISLMDNGGSTSKKMSKPERQAGPAEPEDAATPLTDCYGPLSFGSIS